MELVPVDNPCAMATCGSSAVALAQDRQAAKELHHHRQIWVKEPHGGPYRKADLQLAKLSGRSGPPELGYEVVAKGPTTNFVGNHMTQGAIDLVQAELSGVEGGLLQLEYSSTPHNTELHHARPGPVRILTAAECSVTDSNEASVSTSQGSGCDNLLNISNQHGNTSLEDYQGQQQAVGPVAKCNRPDLLSLRKMLRQQRGQLMRLS